MIDLLAADKSRYFAQPRPIIVNCLYKEAKTISVLLIYLFRRKYFFFSFVVTNLRDLQSNQLEKIGASFFRNLTSVKYL